MFKDEIKKDLDVFVEDEEFAEEIELDGVKLTGQVISHTAEKSGRLQETFDGLHGDFITLYFKTDDYCSARKRIPREGEWAMINGKRYDVMNAADELGITRLICSAYRQNVLR